MPRVRFMKRAEAVVEKIRTSPDPRPKPLQEYPRKPLHETLYYRFLYELVGDLQPAVIVEIGTRRGESAIQMASACPKTQVITIDTNPGSAEYIRKMGLKNLRSIICDSAKAVPEVEVWSPIDILFIDSDHVYDQAIREFRDYAPLVRKNGMIILDDIHINEGMDRFWNEIKYPKLELNHLHTKGFGIVIRP